MRKKVFLYIVVFLIFFNINIFALESSSREYLSATEYDYPPFSVTSGGKADGFSVELLKAVAEEMGFLLDFKIDEWNVIKKELEEGKLDVLPLVGYTEERDEVYDFTVPYIVMRGNIFVRKNSDIKSEDDLYGKELLVMDGDNAHEYVERMDFTDNLILTPTYEDAFVKLSQGEGDAVLAQSVVGEKLIKDLDLKNIRAVTKLSDDGVSRIKVNLSGFEQKFSFAVQEGNDELLGILNEGLAIVSTNGKYDELYKKWFPFLIEEGLSAEDVVKYVLFIVVPLIFLLLLISYLSVRKEVKRKTEKIEKTSFRNNILFNLMKEDYETEFEHLDFVLNELIKLTESKYGYIYLYDKDKREFILNSWSKDVMPECRIAEKETRYKLDTTGIWGEVVRQRKPIITNDFQKPSELKKGYPEGHVSLKKYMSFPVLIDNEIVAVVGLANKEEDYDKYDLHQSTILMQGVWNVMERKHQVEEIKYLSFHDSLTGLYNRRFFEEEMKRLDTPRNYPLTIVMGDLNSLKIANDAFGHEYGDELLKKAAFILKENCREDDIIARWGGDEFAIILPKTGSMETSKIISRIEKSSSQVNKEKISLSISFGWDTKNNKEEKLNRVFKKAEDNMYKKKFTEYKSIHSLTIKTIINTLFEKSPREKNHSERVKNLSLKLAEELNLKQHEIDEIATLGLLHDIGKIIISREVLEKPTKLNEDEWIEIKKHPSIGYRMLSTTSEFSDIALGVLSHHEKWDGTGYPKGLKDEEIPLKSRIIALADAYDAMTSPRPYRPNGLSKAEAIEEIRKNLGKQFDPCIGKVFIEKVINN
jgi:diguanylate cyclase (GGDEF)-like protein